MDTGTPSTPRPFYDFDEPGTLRKPGPIGRLVRLGLGIPLLWIVWRLVFHAGADDLAYPPFWLVVLLLLWLFPAVINIGFGLEWGNLWPRIGVVVAALLGGAVDATAGEAFAGPVLWWVLRVWMIYVAGHLGVSFVLAGVLGTPGCEMRALPHLADLVTGHRRREHYCPSFLDDLDRWEAYRRGKPDAESGGQDRAPRGTKDLLAGRTALLWVYGLPFLAITVSGNFGNRETVTVVWPVAFAVMGLVGLINALRCGRVHCYFTAPLFLLAAALSLLQGLGILSLGRGAWELIGNGAFLGGMMLYLTTERIWGKYFVRRSKAARP